MMDIIKEACLSFSLLADGDFPLALSSDFTDDDDSAAVFGSGQEEESCATAVESGGAVILASKEDAFAATDLVVDNAVIFRFLLSLSAVMAGSCVFALPGRGPP
jgi:hypothetical protein